MHAVILLLLFYGAQSYSFTSVVRRGNLFQQLSFMAGIPLNELYFNMILRIILQEHSISASTKCHVDIYCARSGFCREICRKGSVVVNPWIAFSTRTQASLSTFGSFCEHQSIGTHNSAITAAYGFGVEDQFYSMILASSYLQFSEVRTFSQYYSITDQLNLGIRHIELDIHYFHSQLRISHCGFSVGIVNYVFHFLERWLRLFHFAYDTETIGCLPSFNGIPAEDQLLMTSVLDEIADWLREERNRDEFVILYLDTSENLVRWNQVTTLRQAILDSFGNLVVRPSTEWSIRESIRHGQRLMLVSRRQFDGMEDLLFYPETTASCKYPFI